VIHRTHGVVVGRINFGNTSQIVTLLTPDHGVVGLLAKGVWRRSNPQFTGPFELARLYEFVFFPRPRAQLGVVADAEEVDAFCGLRACRERLADAFLVLAFVRQFGTAGAGDPQLFRLVTETLRALSSPSSSPGGGGVLLSFLKAALHGAGVFPALDRCVVCGRPRGRAGAYDVSFSDGGLRCHRHRGGPVRTLTRAEVEGCLSEGPVAASAPPYGSCVRFLLDWTNGVLASRSRMLEYPFYLRSSAGEPRDSVKHAMSPFRREL
jgi:DNA repair protein RecO (recombination protein O)